MVVTGVSVPASNGLYEIPNIIYVGNQRYNVAGVDPYAFAGTNARVVVLDCRFAREYAFSGCALTHVYICGSMYVDKAAFSGCPQGFQLHTDPSSANTLDGQDFSACADELGGVWVESDWNWESK